MKYVGFAWDVIQWAVYALITGYILDQLHARPEALIVPILGILYCGQAFSGATTAMILMNLNVMLNETVRQLKQLGAGSYLTTEPEPLQKLALKAGVKFYIALFGLAAIFWQCAWKIYTVLSPQLPF
jgi:hypothetical protein